MMSAQFTSLDGYADLPVDRAPVLLVGSHPSCDLRISSSRVSRLHCCMSRGEDQVTIRDLGSTNGTRINGRRVTAGRLREGDELSIAHLRYRLEFGQTEVDVAAATVIRNAALVACC